MKKDPYYIRIINSFQNSYEQPGLSRTRQICAVEYLKSPLVDSILELLWLQRQLEEATWILLHYHTCESHAAFQKKSDLTINRTIFFHFTVSSLLLLLLNFFNI